MKVEDKRKHRPGLMALSLLKGGEVVYHEDGSGPCLVIIDGLDGRNVKKAAFIGWGGVSGVLENAVVWRKQENVKVVIED